MTDARPAENPSPPLIVENLPTVELPLISGAIDEPPLEKRRWGLAFALVVLFAVVIIGHYSCLIALELRGKKTEGITGAFNSILPVVSGLVGSAVAYYFTT